MSKKNYIVSILMETDVLVVAESESEAIAKIKQMVEDDEIELDYMTDPNRTRYEIRGSFTSELDKEDEI